MPQSRRSFVERIDFTTSPGHLGGKRPSGWGGGPTVVVTNLAVYRFADGTGEMELATLHPGVTLDEVRENAAWDVRMAQDLAETAAPTEEELHLIREELDPDGAYTR